MRAGDAMLPPQLLTVLRSFSASLVAKTQYLDGKLGDLQCNATGTKVRRLFSMVRFFV